MELKPCPFCGKQPYRIWKDGGSDERCGYNYSVKIACNCGITLEVHSKKDESGWVLGNQDVNADAVKKWNKRIKS